MAILRKNVADNLHKQIHCCQTTIVSRRDDSESAKVRIDEKEEFVRHQQSIMKVEE
jgi:hypothetical protein